MSTTPQLDDILTEERLDGMRAQVMREVFDATKRRGGRIRTGLLAAAVVVIVGGLGFSAVSLGGTADSGDMKPYNPSEVTAGGSSADLAESTPAPDADALEECATCATGEAARANGALELDEAGEQAPADADREVITTGSINVTVRDPRAVATKVATWVESIGGRVDARTENGSGEEASAYLTIRVPSTKVGSTVERLKDHGTVESVELSHDDVTSVAKDLDARIDALEISVDRLSDIMRDADTSSKVIEAERELTQRQEQLEALQSQRSQLTDQVSLSTLSIDLSQKTSPGSVETGGFWGGLVDGWNSLVDTVNGLVQALGVALPWIGVAFLALLAYRLVRRLRGRRS